MKQSKTIDTYVEKLYDDWLAEHYPMPDDDIDKLLHAVFVSAYAKGLEDGKMTFTQRSS